MNIKHAFLAILMGTSMVVTADQTIIDDEKQEKIWFESYAAPCIAGGMVGSISGVISAKICAGSLIVTTVAATIATENKVGQVIISLAGLSVIISTLVAENKLRAKCIDWLNKSFENCKIHPNNLTKNSAQILSWFTFLTALV